MRSFTTAVGGALLAACIATPAHGAPIDCGSPVARPAGSAAAAACGQAPWSATQSITFCNPLGRSRGPGGGAGLL